MPDLLAKQCECLGSDGLVGVLLPSRSIRKISCMYEVNLENVREAELGINT